MLSLKSLRSSIKAIQDNSFKNLDIPEEDIRVFKNYKLFPVDILVKADWNYKEDDSFAE